MLGILIILVIGIVLFFIMLGYGSFIYKRDNKEAYSFARFFPFELAPIKNKKGNIVTVIFLIMSFLLINSSNIYNVVMHTSSDNKYIGTMICAIASCLLASISFVYLLFKDTSNIKMHLFGTASLVTFSLIFAVSIAYMGFKSFNDPSKADIDIKRLVIAIIDAVICINLVFFLLSPRLKEWGKLDEIKNDDGTVTYERPKIFIMALIEWVNGISIFVNSLLFFILLA